MTDPQYGSHPGPDPVDGVPPQSSYPPPPNSAYPPPPNSGGYPPPADFGQYPPPPPPNYGQYPPAGAYYDPAAPYGRNPVTGEPNSEKSKVVAGLLQLIGLFGLVGIGRIYLGYTGLGVAQLLVGLVTCGIGAVIWGIIDAVLILTGKVRDPQGRPLRDGT
jgi:TM2 domain-containing membrane protein YozV